MQFTENSFFPLVSHCFVVSPEMYIYLLAQKYRRNCSSFLFVLITTYSFVVWIFFFRLEEGKAYFIEALQKHKNYESHVEVAVP